jgi:hypothetical protein
VKTLKLKKEKKLRLLSKPTQHTASIYIPTQGFKKRSCIGKTGVTKQFIKPPLPFYEVFNVWKKNHNQIAITTDTKHRYGREKSTTGMKSGKEVEESYYQIQNKKL